MKRSTLCSAAALWIAAGCAGDSDVPHAGGPETLAQEEVVPVNPIGGAQLGQGYNSITESYELVCLSGPAVLIPAGPAMVSLDQNLSESQTNSSLGIKVSAAATYGLVNIDVKSEFQRDSQQSDTSLSMVFAEWVPKVWVRLDEHQAEFPLGPPDQHYFECGDRVVTQKLLGGELYFMAKFDFAKSSDKASFAASLNGSFSGYSVATAMSLLRQEFQGRATLKMSAIQSGGRKEQLVQALGGASVVKCQENLDACDNFFNSVQTYAAGDFAAALQEGLWEDLSYLQADWSDFGISTPRGNVPDEVVLGRERLLEASKTQARLMARIDALEGSGYFGNPTDYADVVAGIKSTVQQNIAFLRDAVPQCYDELSTPPTDEQINSCAWRGWVTSRPDADPSYVFIDESLLEVEPAGLDRNGRTDYWTSVTPFAGSFGNWVPGSEDGRTEEYAMCPPRTYANGLRMRVEAHENGDFDDTALNAVTLHCVYADGSEPEDGREITPTEGFYGTWHPYTTCSTGPLAGIAVKSEKYQGGGNGKHDDTGANDLKGICISGERLEQAQEDNGAGGGAPGGERWGTWGGVSADQALDDEVMEQVIEASKCPAGSAVCGLRVRLESKQGSGDDTALNGITLACCKY